MLLVDMLEDWVKISLALHVLSVCHIVSTPLNYVLVILSFTNTIFYYYSMWYTQYIVCSKVVNGVYPIRCGTPKTTLAGTQERTPTDEFPIFQKSHQPKNSI